MVILSDVPVGAGLSSSAALEVSVRFALISLAWAEVDRVALALACQEAEHVYVGAQVGIMDQFIKGDHMNGSPGPPVRVKGRLWLPEAEPI